LTKANYGNWIRQRIVIRFFVIAGGLGLAAFLPLGNVVRIALLVLAGGFLLMALYLTYVYFQFSSRDGDYQRKLHALVLDPLKWTGEGQALDIGTGNGALAIGLGQKFPKAHVIGIDLWGDDWEYSKGVCEANAKIEGVAERVAFQLGSAVALPFPDGTFEVVVSHFVFHEVQGVDKEAVVREALRVLGKGGSFSFQDMFLDEALYGDIPALLKAMRGWEVEEVMFSPSRDLVSIPWLLRHKRVLGKAGIIFGRK